MLLLLITGYKLAPFRGNGPSLHRRSSRWQPVAPKPPCVRVQGLPWRRCCGADGRAGERLWFSQWNVACSLNACTHGPKDASHVFEAPHARLTGPANCAGSIAHGRLVQAAREQRKPRGLHVSQAEPCSNTFWMRHSVNPSLQVLTAAQSETVPRSIWSEKSLCLTHCRLLLNLSASLSLKSLTIHTVRLDSVFCIH